MQNFYWTLIPYTNLHNKTKEVYMNKDNNKELIWGEIKTQDLLKNLYKGKSFDKMSDQEVDRMLEDLI